jgi:hypothetical protein
MSTENRVFNKLFKGKTKLSKKMVLSSIPKIEELTKNAELDYNVFDDMLDSWVTRYLDLQNEVTSLVNMREKTAQSMFDLDNAMADFASNAEELGLNPFRFDEFANATLTTGSYGNNIENLNDIMDAAENMTKL